ncbi:MAG: phosphoribosylaminoimidazolesuccinocarboxamide synthase [Candidatus Neomarinimicrobiota bacterium]
MNRTDYTDQIRKYLDNCLTATSLDRGEKIVGKVRDTYLLEDQLVLITTDRLSAFDRVLAAIPFKGQVLNQTSAWWFEQTHHIIPNHVLSTPDPNVTIGKKCTVFPIEFVVRGYITGSTDTALWTHYKNGSRNYCGNELPEGLVKNQKLAQNIITPTTKEKEHDRPISPAEIVSEGWMSVEDWAFTSAKALELFRFGQETAARHGLILVDTKYEMGRDADGNILLIDEIHTPDSSRYWIAATYAERLAAGREPQNIDKEFLRLWFRDNCDPYHDTELPPAPEELVIELSNRYIYLYENITGKKFVFPDSARPIGRRIQDNVTTALNS